MPNQAPCPVNALHGALSDHLSGVLNGAPYVLITSEGWLKRGLKDLISKSGVSDEQCLGVWSSVPDNPQKSIVLDAYDTICASLTFPANTHILAIGGGSVMDAAKAISFLISAQGDEKAFINALKNPDVFEISTETALPSLIMVPTTSGTGSEVTRWATIWTEGGGKESLSHPRLYPQHVIMDASLCLSMPINVTLTSGLDALSHACEAIWNNNATDKSDRYACDAISDIARYLPLVLQDPQNASCRAAMQQASLMAGQAMSITRTALAHSISYPLTGHYGLTHGLACSFTLPEIAQFNAEYAPDRCGKIKDALNRPHASVYDALGEFLAQLNINEYIVQNVPLLDKVHLEDLHLINPARADNNIRPTSPSQALDILKSSIKRVWDVR